MKNYGFPSKINDSGVWGLKNHGFPCKSNNPCKKTVVSLAKSSKPAFGQSQGRKAWLLPTHETIVVFDAAAQYLVPQRTSVRHRGSPAPAARTPTTMVFCAKSKVRDGSEVATTDIPNASPARQRSIPVAELVPLRDSAVSHRGACVAPPLIRGRGGIEP